MSYPTSVSGRHCEFHRCQFGQQPSVTPEPRGEGLQGHSDYAPLLRRALEVQPIFRDPSPSTAAATELPAFALHRQLPPSVPSPEAETLPHSSVRSSSPEAFWSSCPSAGNVAGRNKLSYAKRIVNRNFVSRRQVCRRDIMCQIVCFRRLLNHGGVQVADPR